MLGVHPASAASGQTSFKVTLSGTATLTGETTVSFSGSGTGTRMGHTTNDGSVVLTGPDSSRPNGVANVNREKLTNNDGDTLTIMSQDVSCPIGSGQYHGTGQWIVTGGTGRFEGATGQGSLDGSADFNAGTFTIHLIGTLAQIKA